MTPRQKEQQDRIFSVVRDLVSKNGYEAVSMRSVARDAGVATATLYNLYNSKDGLVMAVLRDSIFKVTQFDRASFDNPIDLFFARTQAIYQDLVKNPNFARAMMKVFFNATETEEIVEIIARTRLKTDRQVIMDLREAGLLHDNVDSDVVAHRLTGNSLSGLLFWEKGLMPTRAVPDYVRQRDVEVFRSILNDKGLGLLG